MVTREKITPDPEGYGSNLLKSELLAPQRPPVFGMLEMPCTSLAVAPDHLKRMSTDAAYLREMLQDSTVAEWRNWIVATKHGPYTDRDVMLMYNMADGAKPNLHDLGPTDMRETFELAEAIMDDWQTDRPESQVLIGLNRGVGQSIKNIHLHVVSLPSEELDSEHPLSSQIPTEKVSVGIDESNAVRQFSVVLAYQFTGVNPPMIFASTPRYCQIQLEGRPSANLDLIRRIDELAEAELVRHQIYDNGKRLWGYSISINSNNQLRIGFHRQVSGIMEMNGYSIRRNPDLGMAPIEKFNAETKAIVQHTLDRLS